MQSAISIGRIPSSFHLCTAQTQIFNGDGIIYSISKEVIDHIAAHLSTHDIKHLATPYHSLHSSAKLAL
jgi:hypothetical protein